MDLNTLYTPLDQLRRQFRLLRFSNFEPGTISCELAVFSLLDKDLTPWKALSYRWGHDEPAHEVYLNHHCLYLQKNLQAFLTQMVAEERQDWFFIDALCINQEHEAEKTYQVSQMGEIYKHAEEVVAWMVYEKFPPESHEDNSTHDYYDDARSITSMSHAQIEEAVLENPYWTRLWILQEVLLAKRLTIRIESAEVEWLNLLPEKTYFERRGLPRKNAGLGINQLGSNTDSNKTTAINILKYRRFETKSLRAGNHIPFHKAFDFFSMQHCSNPLDKVFGYHALTNSRVQVDYSMPILDLFVATLADYFMSAGLITEDLKPLKRRMELMRTQYAITSANDLVVPFLAFNLDPFDPVINVIFCEVTRFFAPGFEEGITATTLATWWCLERGSAYKDIENLILADHTFELKHIGSVCIKFVKLIANNHSAMMKAYKESVEKQKMLAREDTVISTGADGQSRRYHEWVEYAKAIAQSMWQRYQESGEDTEGCLDDDESWSLIA